MARPKKIGLDYFPMDVDMDQDDKIYLVKADYGWEGFSIVVKLLMDIYKESYYIEWDERKAKIFSRKNLFNLETVNAVINLCLEEDMFDNNLFEKYSILTSKGIQTRYLEATTRRKNVLIYKDFLLIDIKDITNNNLTIVNVDINPNSTSENVGKSAQSKVKESKVKESKEKVVEEEEEPSTTTSPDAIVFYQNNIGVITPHVAEEILNWINDLGDEMIIEALSRALDRNKPSWGYAKSILNSWIKKNIKTIEQAKAEEVQFQNQQANRFQPKSKEIVPDWFKDRNKQSNKLPNESKDSEEDVAALLESYKQGVGGN